MGEPLVCTQKMRVRFPQLPPSSPASSVAERCSYTAGVGGANPSLGTIFAGIVERNYPCLPSRRSGVRLPLPAPCASVTRDSKGASCNLAGKPRRVQVPNDAPLRGTQVAREATVNRSFAGSIPARAAICAGNNMAPLASGLGRRTFNPTFAGSNPAGATKCTALESDSHDAALSRQRTGSVTRWGRHHYLSYSYRSSTSAAIAQ